MDYLDLDRIDIETKFTEIISGLSKERKLIWKRNELGHYLASYKKMNIQIEFFNFSRMDEESSDDSCGTVTIEISEELNYNKIGFDFSVGTKQFSNLKKAISYNFKDWRSSLQRDGRKYVEVLKYMKNI